MFGRNSSEELLKKIIRLDAVEFLGVCKILGIKLYEIEAGSEDDTSSAAAREFIDIWNDLCDKVDNLSRTRRKNLNKLISAATKKGE